MKKTLALLAILTATSLSSLANETIWSTGIDPLDNTTYYFFTKRGGKDADMCGVISAACTLAWWQDQVEKSGALIMPENQPRGEKVWDAILSHWKGAAQPARVLQFWLSGDSQYSNDDQWFTDEGKAFKATGGCFPRIAGTHYDFGSDFTPPSGCMITSVDTRGYSDTHTYEAGSRTVADLLRHGYGGTLSTGYHAMVMYGVEVDENDNIVKVYYDDNNYSSGNPVSGELPHSANVYQGQQRPAKEGDTQARYAMGASVGYSNEISSFALIRTTGIQFTDYDVRVGKNFGSKDEFLFSHYCNLLVDGAQNYELKYDLRDASAKGSPVDPIQTTYDHDGRTVLDQKVVTTGNIRLMDGTVTLVDASGDTAKFDKGGSAEGIVSFEHSAKSGADAVRKLSVQWVGASVGELAVKATEGTNELEVTEGNTLSIGKLSGEGNLDKTGTGTAEVTGEVTMTGKINVQAGKFILGENAELSASTLLTVGTEGKMESKVEKPVTLSITSGVHTNDGEMLLTTTVSGGTLKGSGTFAMVTIDGGEMIVGNSPGHQNYEGALTLNSGRLVFCAAGLDTANDGDNTGWASGTYSTINMNGHDFVVNQDGKIVIALSADAANSLTSANGTVELTLATGLKSGAFSEEQLAALAEQTSFELSVEEGAGSGAKGLSTLNAPKFSYKMVNDALVLTTGVSGGSPAVPEPATGTLSLLALAGLCARRRRQ